MSYAIKCEYEIYPEGSYKVLRNCAKCGGKSYFINTNNFRVNANGNRLDVWLIYQCEKCKHTFNLTIYERKKPSEIREEEYKKFLANDITLATEYGNKNELFTKNKAEICLDAIQYRIAKQGCNQPRGPIIIRNPYEIKVRTERVLADILKLTRRMVKTMVEEGKISDIPKYVSKELEVLFMEGDFLDKNYY